MLPQREVSNSGAVFCALHKSVHLQVMLLEVSLFWYVCDDGAGRHVHWCAAAFPESSGSVGTEGKAAKARTLAFAQIHTDPEARTHHQMSWLP